MISILFICHGNICRSPMAEFVLRDYAQKLHLEPVLDIDSAATSTEELGHGVYPPVRAYLKKMLPTADTAQKRARQITREDGRKFDYIIAMEQYNLDNLRRLYPDLALDKLSLLLDYTETPGDIADPWYTREFDTAYHEIIRGCRGLLQHLAAAHPDLIALEPGALDPAP